MRVGKVVGEGSPPAWPPMATLRIMVCGMAVGVGAVGVEGLVQVRVVESEPVDGDEDAVFVPVHAPDVELVRPIGVAERVDGLASVNDFAALGRPR